MLCVGVGVVVLNALVELCGAGSEGVKTRQSRRRSWRGDRVAAVSAALLLGEIGSPDG